MLYVIAGAALLFITACVLLAGFITGGRRQTFDEALNWQSERYDTSFYGSSEKVSYTVQGDGGYILNVQAEGILRRIPCRHSAEDMYKELQIMVDNGCLVKDVIVEHPVYGQLAGELNISTRHDVSEFMRRVKQKDASPLSDLTGGIHLHTVLFPDQDAYERVVQNLREAGFLYETDY